MTDESELLPENESENPPEVEPVPEMDESEAAELVEIPPESAAESDDDSLPDDGSIPAEAFAVSRQMSDLIALETDGLDVDEALAAVASLGELVTEPDEDMLAGEDEFETGELAEPESEPEPEPEPVAYQSTATFRAPPLMTLHRGQMASVIPALLLIVIGAWLVFALTTAKNTPDAGLVVAIAIGGTGLALLAQGWSNRWAQGSLFFGLTLLFSAGIFLGLWRTSDPGLARGWPLFITAGGAAFALSAFLSPASQRQQGFIGLAIALAGVVGYAVTAEILNSALVDTIGSLWPVVVVVLLVLWGLPLIFRGRG